MAAFLTALALSFGVVFLAELGDKSQLMALTFATRYRPLLVLAGITVAAAAVMLVSVAVGYGVGAVLPTGWTALVAGLLFLGFAAWTLRGGHAGTERRPRPDPRPRAAVLTVAATFFLAELGDKTMIATIALAARHGWLGTWVGATAGMVAADALAILVGGALASRLPERTIRYGSAAMFAVLGGWLVVEAVRLILG